MKRHGLEERLKDELGLSTMEFSEAIGLKPQVLRKYHTDKRLLLKLIIAGYRAEVLCGHDPS